LIQKKMAIQKSAKPSRLETYPSGSDIRSGPSNFFCSQSDHRHFFPLRAARISARLRRYSGLAVDDHSFTRHAWHPHRSRTVNRRPVISLIQKKMAMHIDESTANYLIDLKKNGDAKNC